MQQKIRTKAFAHICGEQVDVDTLKNEQRVRLATALKTTYLNALYSGKAVFGVTESREGKENSHGTENVGTEYNTV